jgi:cob(I)alamin adenosyltransferase
MSKISTGIGDRGNTYVVLGIRKEKRFVSKSSSIVRSLGAIDSARASINFVAVELAKLNNPVLSEDVTRLRDLLSKVTLSLTEISVVDKESIFKLKTMVSRISMECNLPEKLNSPFFVENELVCRIDLARTAVRAAECLVVEHKGRYVNDVSDITVLNLISDYLYVLMYYVNEHHKVKPPVFDESIGRVSKQYSGALGKLAKE